MKMANQYAEGFQSYIKRNYELSVEAVFLQFQKAGFDYRQVALTTGFKESTVRKYSRLSGVMLKQAANALSQDKLYTQLRAQRVNKVNILSMRWVDYTLSVDI
ncbi:hypothetical protein [Fangia hongkongensis]|uniref:hypothetical protein n=1 Tax=Fangia hongkongensis TaxID=270495 RepID=UPI000377292E|nr:hypothetical protein [Fangia hongkongensis]MBK2124169.1 hypothetical protein [Fangia hongkongensis]